MKLIQRYLLQEYFPVFIVALIFFVLMLELGDLFANLWKYLSFNVPMKNILQIMILYIPKCISYSMPLAVLFSSSYTIGNFYAKNELIAIFASGFPLYRLASPLIAIGMLMSIFMFFFEDNLVIPTVAKKNLITKTVFSQDESLSNTDVVFISDSGKKVYIADYYQDNEVRLYSLMVIGRDDNFNLDYVYQAPDASWNGTKWISSSFTLYDIDKTNKVSIINNAESIILDEPPDSFRRHSFSVDELSASDAKSYIESLRKSGLSYSEHLANYYKRFSFPFTIFIVLFFSISLAGRFKKNIVLMSLLMSLSIGVLFYILQMVSMLFAKWEYISPFVGAWFPVLLFISAGAIIMKRART